MICRVFTMILLSGCLTGLSAPGPAAAAETEGTAAAPGDGTGAAPWELLQDYRYPQVVAARRGFEAILEDQPEDPRALAGLAASLAIGMRYTWEQEPGTLMEADGLSSRAIQLEPDRVESQFARALVEILQLDFRSAEDRSRRALHLPGPVQAARFSLGEALLHQGRWGEAEEVFRDALGFDPHSCPATAGLSDSLRQQERYQEAIEATDRLLESRPDCYPTQLSRAVTAHRGRQTRYAVRLLKILMKKYPESAGVTTLNAAAIMFSQGRHGYALAVYRGLDLPSGSRYLRLLRDIGIAECEIRLGLSAEGADRLRGFIADFPPIGGGDYLRSRLLFPAYTSLARLYRSQGNRGDEIALLEQAAEEPDVTAGLLHLLSDAYSDLGLEDRALDTLVRAARSQNFESVHEQGRILIDWLHEYRRGSPSGIPPGLDPELIRDYEDRVRRDGGFAAYYSLARFYALLDRPGRSIDWLERAVGAGYRDVNHLRTASDFDSVRNRRKFRRLVRRLEAGDI